MSIESNKALVRQLFTRLYDEHDVSVYDDICSPDYQYHVGPREISGLAAAKENSAGIFARLPDFRASIEDIVAEGDRVVTRNLVTGGIGTPDEAKALTVNIFRIAGGRIVERWSIQERI